MKGSETPLCRAYDAALVDLDGVLYRGPHPIDHAATSLGAARVEGMSVVFVTNNASREPQEVADHLSTLGVAARAADVLTSAQATGAHLAAEFAPGTRALVVGGQALVTAVREAGLTVVSTADDRPEVVVQGFAPDVGWRQLAEAAYAIQRGAAHVATNRDRTLPNERGFAPGNGALVGAVVAATGREPASVGKPEPGMFRLAARRVSSARPLVIGDRLDTDLAGARAAGMPGLHVFTGVSGVRDVILAVPEQRPTYLGADLRSLLHPHPAPTLDDGWWRVTDSAARVTDGRLELRGPGADGRCVPIDLVRAACAAAWAAADAGAALPPTAVGELTVCEPRS